MDKELPANSVIVESINVGIHPKLARILLHYSYKRLDPESPQKYDEAPLETIVLVLDRKRAEDLVGFVQMVLPDIP